MNAKSTRAANVYYNANFNYQYVPNKENDGGKMQGSRRVITFCILTSVLPTILIVLPLYLRNVKYADVMYKISDSDVIQIHKGQSSFFCEKHSIYMNSSFNAFQMKGTPELSDSKKHIRLKKSMNIPVNTLEYWGFYLFKGATVELRACSRLGGSKILVVKGDKTLNTCGILEGNKYKKTHLSENQGHVYVTLEHPRETPQNPDSDTDNSNAYNFHSSIEDISYNNDTPKLEKNIRQKRSSGKPIHKPNTVLDTGVNHGGNAFNSSQAYEKTITLSSFEKSLHECYHNKKLINHGFPNSTKCLSTKYIESTTILKVVHEVLVDGYYYYIFYSVNDVVNDINVIFDIYKPTFQYVNITDSKVCINQTKCEFDVGFLSDELVIVEVPTKNGFNHEEDDSSILVSVCHPRISIYIIFPISVLLLILLFAFL